jgi:phage gp29-like protein
MASVLDQFGNVIPPEQIAALRQEISAPSAMNARPPFSGHLAFGIDPGRLGAIIRAADAGNSLEWMILAEEIEELFPHYQSVLSKRRRQVCQLPITVEDAGPGADFRRHGDLVRDWVDTGVLQRALFDVTDAIGKGFSVSEVIWDSRPGRIVPAELAYRAPRYFELSWEDGATVWLRSQLGFEDLAPHKFLLHTHRSKSGLMVRSGLTRQVAWVWMYATYTVKDWAIFTQAYGLPIRVGRYGPEASEPDKRVLWRAVSSIAGDVAAIIPKSMELEFVKDTDRAAGAALYEHRASWLNREVSKLVLGSTAGTEAISGGHAVGQEHREVEADVERFDAFLLSNSVTRQLVQAMVAFTHGPQEKYPRLNIGRQDEVPLKDVIDAVADLGGMGFKVKAADLYKRLQMDPPEEGDVTVGGVPPQPEPKPILPRPAIEPPYDAHTRRSWLSGLIARHAEAPPELVEQLVDRLSDDAAGALAGLIAPVRHAFEAATSMQDLAHRLAALDLDVEAFAEAMARGMALANLVGQAEMAETLHPSGRTR